MTVLRTSRSGLLSVLESVSPGLATRELIQQGTCFVFSKGNVYTFNDEIACWRKSPIDLTGALKAQSLLDLLSKMTEDEIEIEQTPGAQELQIRGKGKKAGLIMEAEVLLPIESVEIPDDSAWNPVDPEFTAAVSLIHSCASTEESTFVLTCIHLTPDYIEATDRFQVARYPVATGLSSDILIRSDSLKKMTTLDMNEVAESGSWIHYRNPAGLHLSCRKYSDTYPTLNAIVDNLGETKISLPGGLKEVVDRCSIFSSENATGVYVTVEIRADRIVVGGEGPGGWYKEMKKISFTGDPIEFSISPKLLIEVSGKSSDCFVTEGRLSINTGKLKYVTCTNALK